MVDKLPIPKVLTHLGQSLLDLGLGDHGELGLATCVKPPVAHPMSSTRCSPAILPRRITWGTHRPRLESE